MCCAQEHAVLAKAAQDLLALSGADCVYDARPRSRPDAELSPACSPNPQHADMFADRALLPAQSLIDSPVVV